MHKSTFLIAPKFFEYDEILEKSFTQECERFESFFYDESKYITRRYVFVLPYFLFYFLLVLFPKNNFIKKFMGIFNSKRKNYDRLNKILIEKISQIPSNKYKNLFIVKGAGFGEDIYHALDEIGFSNKNLILWDPIYRYPETNTQFFDKIFSTEYPECMEFSWNYLGLFSSFYGNKHDLINEEKEYFVSFIGSLSPFRFLALLKAQIRLRVTYGKLNNHFILVNSNMPMNIEIFDILITNKVIDSLERQDIIQNSQFTLSMEEPGQWSWSGRIADTVCLGGRILSSSIYVNEWKNIENYKNLPIYNFTDNLLEVIEINSNFEGKYVFDVKNWVRQVLT